MNPADATYIRNNSIGILIVTALLFGIAWHHPDNGWRYAWIPLVAAAFGTLMVLSRYRHFR